MVLPHSIEINEFSWFKSQGPDSFFTSAIYFVNMSKQLNIIKNVILQIFVWKRMFVGSLQETKIFITKLP